MTPPVRAWPGDRARRRVVSLVARLSRLAAAVVLLCALWPAVASARSERRSHVDRQAVHTSQHRATRSARFRLPDLHLGSGESTRHGSVAVRRLQRGLRRAGYAPGPVDGRYGPLTTAAVERFQSNHRLHVDGIVGPATWHALRAAPTLALGAGEAAAHGSPAVARLQRLLRRAGFSPGRIDGRLGPRTERAIIRFQRARHLTADGIAGPVTEHALGAARRTTRHPADTRRGRRAQPRSGPATQLPSPAKPLPASTGGLRPQPARPKATARSRPPLGWILIGLGVLALLASAAGHLRSRRRARRARGMRRPSSSIGRRDHAR